MLNLNKLNKFHKINNLNRNALAATKKQNFFQMHIFPKRFLNIYEHEAKRIMEHYGVRVQKGGLAKTEKEADSIGRKLLSESRSKLVILKAQVLAGGRGKGHYEDGFKGGIHAIRNENEFLGTAKEMLNKRLITKQTTKEGEMVSSLLVLDGLDFQKERYLAILLDRKTKGVVMVGSKMGGMNIEEVAEKSPASILKIPVDTLSGVTDDIAKEMAVFLDIPAEINSEALKQMKALYKLFVGEHATQLEINPLVVAKDSSGEDKIFCVDAKLNVDDNAPKNEKRLASKLSSSKPKDPREEKAAANNLSFIPLDGSIGCMVNGAGLAMATMDIIQQKGGSPANFLDVGGGANEEQVKAAFELITSDPKVKAILVNIFGGILRCDVLARGIVNAAKSASLKVPLVVRLEGTNSDEGRKILAQSGLSIKTAGNLDDAAEKAVLFASATDRRL